MDGEKDPRNLLVAFRIVHDLISRDYNLGISYSLELVVEACQMSEAY